MSIQCAALSLWFTGQVCVRVKKKTIFQKKTLLAMYEKNILTELTSFEQGTIFTTERSNIQIILKFDLKQNINNNNTH